MDQLCFFDNLLAISYSISYLLYSGPTISEPEVHVQNSQLCAYFSEEGKLEFSEK